METFKLAMKPGTGDNGGDTKEVEILGKLKYKGRTIVLHAGNDTTFKYWASDYATGYGFGACADTKREAFYEAKVNIMRGISIKYDFSQHKTINP